MEWAGYPVCGAEQKTVFLVILVQKSIPNDGAAPAKRLSSLLSSRSARAGPIAE